MRLAKRDILSLPVLLLNRHFAPVTVATAKRAFCLLYGGAAHAVDHEGDTHDFSNWLNLPVRDDDDGLPIIGREIRVIRFTRLNRSKVPVCCTCHCGTGASRQRWCPQPDSNR